MSEGAPRRLREERTRLGKNQRDFAALAGVSKNTQLAYETGTSPIPLDYLTRLAGHGVDVAYVAMGIPASDSPRLEAVKPIQPGADVPDVVQISEIDLRYGLGATYIDGHVDVATRSFSRAWLRNFTDSPPEELFWARGQGDSMEKTIHDNDIVLIDRRQKTPHMADLIWAFAFGQIGMIKRLRPLPDGSVKILSDNSAVPPETAHDDELHIIGRVVAVVKRV